MNICIISQKKLTNPAEVLAKAEESIERTLGKVNNE